jgi:site-specific recombinase XerC
MFRNDPPKPVGAGGLKPLKVPFSGAACGCRLSHPALVHDMAKFVALVGHDEANRVTPQQIVQFKEHLAGRGLGAPTINRYLSAIKSPLAWAKENHKIATNPGAGIKYASRGGTRKGKRLGYTDDQARVALLVT